MYLPSFISIGCVLPITGVNDTTDNDAIQKLSLFIKTIEYERTVVAKYNVTIEFIIYDVGGIGNGFTAGAESGYQLTMVAFKKLGIHGVIGASVNVITEPLSGVLSEADVIQISYSCDASVLSHTGVYQTHNRITPSSTTQAIAIIDLISNTFKWRRIVAIYTTDTDGLDGLSVLQIYAAR